MADDAINAAGRRRARPGGRTERHTDAIYRATLLQLAERGYAGLAFNDIAAAAGVARSTLYRRWSGRAELVLDAIGVSLSEAIVAPDTGSLVEDMRQTLRQIGAYISTPLGAAVVAASLEIGATGVPGGRLERWRERLSAFDAMFDRATARGEIASDLDRTASFALAAGAIHFRLIFTGEALDEAWVGRVVATWERSLARS
ncbi:MAG: TetR/AcrR family transcriptional regulator [Phenylobacterium sp.]|uniref:TetR/AcrR family transcriptional regulator n=1 Tax=Phenylobacterium sp. TaxID=1871053 RepID=UPI001A6345B0|nr:TetR/AcrR family transcriptional regulator [Phenylobacterium sp.]MBL8555593.1 TetR/AcrR family transcriptional regulator [Phenylobacterium sp.]